MMKPLILTRQKAAVASMVSCSPVIHARWTTCPQSHSCFQYIQYMLNTPNVQPRAPNYTTTVLS